MTVTRRLGTSRWLRRAEPGPKCEAGDHGDCGGNGCGCGCHVEPWPFPCLEQPDGPGGEVSRARDTVSSGNAT